MNQYPTQQPYSPPPAPANRIFKPVLTYTLLGVTVAVYLLQLLSQFTLGNDWLAILGAKIGFMIRGGEVWRLITPVFLHLDILHILMNMYGLFIFGPRLELRFGRARFALLYFLSAFAGNVLSFLLTPNPSLGASTAIFGLLAAEGMYLLQNRELVGDRGRAQIMNILVVAGYNLLIGFAGNRVDNWGHIGGLLGGLIFTWFGGPRFRMEGYRLVDERQGHGLLAGTVAVLLFFIPLAALGWFWY